MPPFQGGALNHYATPPNYYKNTTIFLYAGKVRLPSPATPRRVLRRGDGS